MSGVRRILNYAGCSSEAAGSVDGVNGWEAGLRDGTGLHSRPFVVPCGLGQSRSPDQAVIQPERMLSMVHL